VIGAAGAHARGEGTSVSTGILTVAVVMCAIVLLGASSGRWRVVPVLSGSMEPAYASGDLAVVVPRPTSEIRVGDVIVYHVPVGDHRREIHRVVDVTHGPGGTEVVTKGDANPVQDPWVARLDGPTVWRATHRIPWLGHAVLALGQPAVRFPALAVAIGLLLAIGLRRIWASPASRPVTPAGASDAGA
jgi:signal peptidase I